MLSGIVWIVLMSPFLWQSQNLCGLSLAFIIDRRVVMPSRLVNSDKWAYFFSGHGNYVCHCRMLLRFQTSLGVQQRHCCHHGRHYDSSPHSSLLSISHHLQHQSGKYFHVYLCTIFHVNQMITKHIPHPHSSMFFMTFHIGIGRRVADMAYPNSLNQITPFQTKKSKAYVTLFW